MYVKNYTNPQSPRYLKHFGQKVNSIDFVVKNTVHIFDTIS